jgi:UDP-glucose 4-epimerase
VAERWLVTGGGFLATRLIACLRSCEVEVVNIQRSRVEPIPGVQVVACPLEQLTHSRLVEAGVGRVDVLAHVAGFIPKRRAEANDAERAIRDNVQATHQLLESLPEAPGRVLFTSTIDLYSRPVSLPLLEESAIRPTDLYGASKLMCEAMVTAWAQAHETAATALRVGHLYGPGEAGYQKLVPLTIAQLLGGRRPVVYGDGSALVDLLHVDDCAEAIVRIGMAELPLPPVINIVGAPSVTVREVVELLIEITRSSVDIEYKPDLPQAAHFSADVSLLDRIAGAWEHIPLPAGLASEVASMSPPAPAPSTEPS